MRRRQQIDEQTAEIIQGLEDEEDPRTAWGIVKRRIDKLEREGREVPEALVVAERRLMTECISESQGR
jgi:hypothetical protein